MRRDSTCLDSTHDLRGGDRCAGTLGPKHSVPQIAEHGWRSRAACFYPALPWIVGAVGRGLEGPFLVLAGVVVSLCATPVGVPPSASPGLFEARAADAGELSAYTGVFPMTLFTFPGRVPESLSLLARRVPYRRGVAIQLPTGLLAGLAVLTRPTGFALIPPLLIARAGGRGSHCARAFLSLVVSPVCLPRI